MMEVEVVQTTLGNFVPLHLLEFKEDPVLHSYLRQIMHTNYEKGIAKLDAGVCENCYGSLTWNDQPRVQQGHRMTNKIRKIMLKSKERPMGKYEANLVKRYLSSSSNLIVKCRICQHVNKRGIATTEFKQAIKNKLQSSTEMAAETSASGTAAGKKKKKKKKKKKNDFNCGLIIPPEVSKLPASSATSTEVSAVLTPKAAATTSSSDSHEKKRHGDFSNPVSPAKMTANTKDTQIVQRKDSGIIAKVANGLQKAKTKTLDKRKNNVAMPVVRSSQTCHKQLKPKHLKEFLSQNKGVKKPTSLEDFLSSL